MYSLSILSCFKNETHILKEWIEHYKTHGVEHIYMINDFSTDNFQNILNPYINDGYITLYNSDIKITEENRQIKLYEKYFTGIIKESEWFFVLDLDEFLYSPNEFNIKKIMNGYEKYSQIEVWWHNFGSNGFKEQPMGVVQNFTKRCVFNEKKEFISFKCGFRGAHLKRFGIHSHEVNGLTKKITQDGGDPNLVVNHYSIQSWKYFTSKKTKIGDINNWRKSAFSLKPCEYSDYFNERDSNEVVDIRLKEQNLQMLDELDDDVTMVVTCCNRPDLFKNTLDSFMKHNTYPIKKVIVIEDSGKIGINDFCKVNYPNVNFEMIYNENNIGQVESIDKAYSCVNTKWIFHCEEDWCFTRKGFIEESFRIFNQEGPKMFTVWLRPYNELRHPILKASDKDYNYMHREYSYVFKEITHSWCGYTFNPGLRRTKDALLFHPYIKNIPIDPLTDRVGEYMINSVYQQNGYYAAITNDPHGYCRHTGGKRHVNRPWD